MILFVLVWAANDQRPHAMLFLPNFPYSCLIVVLKESTVILLASFHLLMAFFYMLLCIDPFTRWIEAFPMPDQTTTSVIQSLNFHMQYFGVPAEIHTDSGCQFTSYSFKQYCQFMGTVHKISSVRYPASNGLAERAIKTVKTALTAKLDSSQWAYHLFIIILSLNSQIKEDLKASPAELLYGQCLRLSGDLFISSAQTHTPSASELIDSMRLFAVSLQPISTRVQQSDSVHLPNTLNTCSHVFIKDDPIYPNLTPAYLILLKL